jgi:hypothetical protein
MDQCDIFGEQAGTGMLKGPGVLLATLAVTCLAGCGEAPKTSGLSVEGQATAAVTACEALVGEELGITGVRGARALAGKEVASWMLSRVEDAPSVPALQAEYGATPELTLCLVDAPTNPYPRPAPVGKPAEVSAEPVVAIAVIGLRDEPVLESVGPESAVLALWRALPSQDAEPSASSIAR